MGAVITSKMIEADLESVWDDINEHDYVIQSSGKIISHIIKGLVPYYIIQIIVAFTCYYKSSQAIGLSDAMLGAAIASIGITLIVVAFFYVPTSIYLSLSDAIKGRSFIIDLGVKKFRTFSTFLFSVVLITSVFNAIFINGDLSVFFPALAMFVGSILIGLCYKLSMMRYLTPGAIKILNKINLFVSGKDG